MKRGIPLVLAAVLCLSLIPSTAMATVPGDSAQVYLEKLRGSENSAIVQLSQTAPSGIGYNNVLSSLSPGEKKALFERLLLNVYVSNEISDDLDCRTASDEILLECLEFMKVNSQFPLSDYGGQHTRDFHTAINEANFTRLTNELFGRTLNYGPLTRTTLTDEYVSYMHQGIFYLYKPQLGYSQEDRVEPQLLYDLGGGKYCAVFQHWATYPEEPEHLAGVVSAVVKRNNDNTWTLIYLYPRNYSPTTAELAAFVKPSDWAEKEVTAAKNAGLVPALTGNPGYQDASTRQQFAELVVTLTEKLTGKEITPAPADTFTDCKETVVLKAYAAGIVSGVGDNKFSPDAVTNREQIAAMIYRAIDYISIETNANLALAAADISMFSDKGAVSPWAVESVGTLAANGIMSGTSATTLSPQNSCTVEQSILLLYRLYEKF